MAKVKSFRSERKAKLVGCVRQLQPNLCQIIEQSVVTHHFKCVNPLLKILHLGKLH